MADHQKFVDLAIRLIAKHGRPVVLVRKNLTAGDSDKPWLGPSAQASPTSVNVLACFVSVAASQFARSIIDDDLLKRVNEIALIQPVSEGLEKMDVLQDTGDYRIEWAEALKPADKTVLYMMGIKR